APVPELPDVELQRILGQRSRLLDLRLLLGLLLGLGFRLGLYLGRDVVLDLRNQLEMRFTRRRVERGLWERPLLHRGRYRLSSGASRTPRSREGVLTTAARAREAPVGGDLGPL